MRGSAPWRPKPRARGRGLVQETTSTFDKLFEKCGAHEAAAAAHAQLPTTGSGQLTDAEADRFLAESSLLFEEIIHFMNISALVSALAFTVAVPLAVLNLDGLSTFDAIDPSLGGAQSLGWYKRWHGPRALHVIHWAGQFLLALSVYAAFNAIALCFVMIPSYSFYLPDVESRLRCFTKEYDKIQRLNAPFSVKAASTRLFSRRISPVASTCAPSSQRPAPSRCFDTMADTGKWRIFNDIARHSRRTERVAGRLPFRASSCAPIGPPRSCVRVSKPFTTSASLARAGTSTAICSHSGASKNASCGSPEVPASSSLCSHALVQAARCDRATVFHSNAQRSTMASTWQRPPDTGCDADGIPHGRKVMGDMAAEMGDEEADAAPQGSITTRAGQDLLDIHQKLARRRRA